MEGKPLFVGSFWVSLPDYCEHSYAQRYKLLTFIKFLNGFLCYESCLKCLKLVDVILTGPKIIRKYWLLFQITFHWDSIYDSGWSFSSLSSPHTHTHTNTHTHAAKFRLNIKIAFQIDKSKSSEDVFTFWKECWIKGPKIIHYKDSYIKNLKKKLSLGSGVGWLREEEELSVYCIFWGGGVMHWGEILQKTHLFLVGAYLQ